MLNNCQLYSEVRKDCEGLIESAPDVLFADCLPLTENISISQAFNVVAIDTTPFARRDIIKIPPPRVDQHLLTVPVQTIADGKHGYVLLEAQENKTIAQPAVVTAEHGTVFGV